MIALPTRGVPVRRPQGFTLIELLVVIAIMAILAALIFPTISKMQKNGHQATSLNNLRQWYVGISNAAGQRDGDLPTPGGSAYSPNDETAWYNVAPPAMGERALNQIYGMYSPKLKEKSIWINPAVSKDDVASGGTGFVFCYGYNALLVQDSAPGSGGSASGDQLPRKMSMIARPALTLLMSEKADAAPDINQQTIRSFFGSGEDPVRDDNGQANILFCDGHVALVKRKDFKNSENVDPSMVGSGRLEMTWSPKDE